MVSEIKPGMVDATRPSLTRKNRAVLPASRLRVILLEE